MSLHGASPCTAFVADRLLASGPLAEVALAVGRAATGSSEPILTFDDASGRVVDLDLRGTEAEILARLPAAPEDEPRGRGRPKLGVVGREVTLLPRQWDWLAAQPGGASVALRRLVDEARRAGEGRERRRKAQEAAYHFTQAIAGDLPGFEEATRALFAGDRQGFEHQTLAWPTDIRDHATRLAFPA